MKIKGWANIQRADVSTFKKEIEIELQRNWITSKYYLMRQPGPLFNGHKLNPVWEDNGGKALYVSLSLIKQKFYRKAKIRFSNNTVSPKDWTQMLT